MPQLKPNKGRRKRTRKPASRGARPHLNDVRAPAAAPAEEPAMVPPLPGRLERTRRLILAALRVWELRRKIRD
jgi:hypothetical protein